MAIENAAKVTMNRINLVFARYEAALCAVLRNESVPQYQLEDATAEAVTVEMNFRRCRNLYEMDAGAFVDEFGEVHGMSDEDILHNILMREVSV